MLWINRLVSVLQVNVEVLINIIIIIKAWGTLSIILIVIKGVTKIFITDDVRL